jgi:hypothetical protein
VIAHISSEQSMPKRTLFCTLGLLALAVAGFLIIPLAWAPRITPESYDKVKEGMQLADVEAILGPPQMRQFRVAWHYDMRTVERLHADFSPEREVAEAIRWQDRGGMIIVGFIASGEVAFKLFDPVPEASFADKLRRCMLRI